MKLAATHIGVKQAALADAAEAIPLPVLRCENDVITFTQLLDSQAELYKARADPVSARDRQIVAGAGQLLTLGRLEPSAVTMTTAGAGG